MKLTLLSRTIGADRVVDEMHVAFRHSQEMPWILPGLPPTNKRVEVLVVSIVTLRGGRLYHEHVYWDQASVLVQVGLLDPKIVPKKASERGVDRLPVVGREAARRVLSGYDEGDEGEATNEMIAEWDDDVDDDDDDDGGRNGYKEDKSINEKPEERDEGKQREEPKREEPEQVTLSPQGEDEKTEDDQK